MGKFAARIGGVMAAPATAMRALRRAPAGQGARDVAVLMLLRLVIGDMTDLVRAVLRARELGFAYGLGAVMRVVSVIVPDVLCIVVAGLLLTLFSRRATLKVDEATPYDLAAYAWVPYLAVQVIVALVDYLVLFAGKLPRAIHTVEIAVGVGLGIAVWCVALWTLLDREDAAPRLPRAATWAGSGLLALLGLIAVGQARSIAQHIDQLELVATPKGTAAPAVDLPLLDGGRFVLQPGQPVFLDFWATWCGPCRQELPSLMRLQSRFANLKVVAVNIEGETARAAISRFVADTHLTLPVAIDDGRVAGVYRVDTIPHGVLIDGNGRVSKVFVGVASENQLADAVRGLH